MMQLEQLFCVFIVILVLINAAKEEEEFFHTSPTEVIQEKVKFPGWQEPGLWRPRWFLYRTIIDESNPTKKPKTERFCLKLNSDRTLLAYRLPHRKLIDWRDPKVIEDTKLNDSPAAGLKQPEDMVASRDGTWWWQDNKDGTGSIKIEVKEKVPKKVKRINEDGEIIEEEEELGFGNLIRYETDITFGKVLDPYAIYFENGAVYKYKDARTRAGVPIGTKLIGSFSVAANPQRPLISKDFMAFQ